MEEEAFRVVQNAYNSRGSVGGSITVRGPDGKDYAVWHKDKDLMEMRPGPDNYFVVESPFNKGDQILDEELRRKIIMAAWPMVDEV